MMRRFLINLHAFTISGTEGACEGVCFLASRFDEVGLVKL